MTFGEDHGWGASPESPKRSSPSTSTAAATSSTPPTSTPTVTPRRSSATTSPPGPACAIASCSSTKFFANLHPGDPNGGGAGRKAIVAQLEQSLRRLQTDYVDLYWLHNWDRGAPVEETLRALDDLVAAGKVRYVGFSDVPAWVAAEAQTIAHFRGWTPVIALQLEYSLLERTSEGELLPMAEALGHGRDAVEPAARAASCPASTRRGARRGRQPAAGLSRRADRARLRRHRRRRAVAAESSASAPPRSRSPGSGAARRSPRR